MEFVYVVKREELFDLHYPQGFLPAMNHQDEIDRYVDRATRRGFFLERRRAETDSSFQQVIPYAIVRRGDEVLLLKRSKRGGDARLHDKLSIGVGGHVNPPDGEADDLLAACARREIEEELVIDGEFKARPVGFINDDSNPVGSVHVGIVHAVELAPDVPVRVRETELLSASFVTVQALQELARDPSANMETWSSLIALALDEIPRLGSDP